MSSCSAKILVLKKKSKNKEEKKIINRGEKIMKRIVLTGGGTAGHVTPNMALVPKLIDEGYNIYYIGSYEGREKKLIEDIGITYYGISSGKLRRYFDIKNFSDPFRVIKGFFEAKKILKKLRPDVVFSKGGFVTVPVVIGTVVDDAIVVVEAVQARFDVGYRSSYMAQSYLLCNILLNCCSL